MIGLLSGCSGLSYPIKKDNILISPIKVNMSTLPKAAPMNRDEFILKVTSPFEKEMVDSIAREKTIALAGDAFDKVYSSESETVG